jgi:integrase/recombinase XerC
MSAEPVAASRPEVDAALLLLAKLGVSPADLVAGAAAARPAVPTFAEFVPQVAAAVTAGTLKAYGSYWNRVVERWGGRRLDEPSPLEIERLGKRLRAGRVIRRNGRGGAGAEENYVAAMRCLYRRAVDGGYVAASFQPRFAASAMPTLRPWPPTGAYTSAASPASGTRPAGTWSPAAPCRSSGSRTTSW